MVPKNFHLLKDKWFDKRPENINKKWRPRKLVWSVLATFKEMWIKPVSADEIKDLYLSLVNSTEKELKDMVNDENQPVLTQLIIKAMLKWNIDVIEKMFDRAIWKAIQKIDQENSFKEAKVTEDKLYDSSE